MTPDHPGGRTSPHAPYQTEAGGPEAGVRVMPARAEGSGQAVETGGEGARFSLEHPPDTFTLAWGTHVGLLTSRIQDIDVSGFKPQIHGNLSQRPKETRTPTEDALGAPASDDPQQADSTKVPRVLVSSSSSRHAEGEIPAPPKPSRS